MKRKIRRLWLKFRVEFWWWLDHLEQSLYDRYCLEVDPPCWVERLPHFGYVRAKRAERDYCDRLGVPSIYDK